MLFGVIHVKEQFIETLLSNSVIYLYTNVIYVCTNQPNMKHIL